MFVALWEYEVKLGCQERFEKTYGPDGEWARLFRGDSKYSETRLLRDVFKPTTYVTLDFWNSRQAYEGFMASHKLKYQNLDALGEELTIKEHRIGWYEHVGP
jgi:hypothetical protein